MRTCDYDEGEKKALLSYMRSFRPNAVAAGFFRDVVTGEAKTDLDYLAFDDGSYSWTTQDIYHVERYDLAPCEGFMSTVQGRRGSYGRS